MNSNHPQISKARGNEEFAKWLDNVLPLGRYGCSRCQYKWTPCLDCVTASWKAVCRKIENG